MSSGQNQKNTSGGYGGHTDPLPWPKKVPKSAVRFEHGARTMYSCVDGGVTDAQGDPITWKPEFQDPIDQAWAAAEAARQPPLQQPQLQQPQLQQPQLQQSYWGQQPAWTQAAGAYQQPPYAYTTDQGEYYQGAHDPATGQGAMLSPYYSSHGHPDRPPAPDYGYPAQGSVPMQSYTQQGQASTSAAAPASSGTETQAHDPKGKKKKVHFPQGVEEKESRSKPPKKPSGKKKGAAAPAAPPTIEDELKKLAKRPVTRTLSILNIPTTFTKKEAMESIVHKLIGKKNIAFTPIGGEMFRKTRLAAYDGFQFKHETTIVFESVENAWEGYLQIKDKKYPNSHERAMIVVFDD